MANELRVIGRVQLIERPFRYSYAVCVRCNRKIYNEMNMVPFKKEIIDGRLITTQIICTHCAQFEEEGVIS